MLSIADRQAKNLDIREPLTKYRYVFRADLYDIEQMTREQLIEMVLEQHAFLLLLLSIIYNIRAEATTRIAAVDLVVQAVRRNVRGAIDTITDAMPVTFAPGNAGSVADRLGFHENCVGSCYKDLVACGAIVKAPHAGEMRTDPKTGKPYRPNLLNVSIRPMFLADPSILEGKKTRSKPEPKVVEEVHPQVPVVMAAPTCEHCGSDNLFAVCRECGEITSLKNYTVESPSDDDAVQEEDTQEEEYRHDEIGQVIESVQQHEKELSPYVPVRSYLDESDKEQLKQFITLVKKHPPKAGMGYLILPGARSGHMLPPRELFDVVAGRLCSPLDEDKRWARDEIVKRFEIWQR